MKRVYPVLLLLVATMLVVSCAPKVRKAVGNIDLSYSCQENKAEKSNLVIALVSSNLITKKITQTQPQSIIPGFPMGRNQFAPLDVNFNNRFRSNYSKQVSTAFNNSFQESITRKGFNLTGPFGTFDDMTYPEKKKAYMALISTLDINFNKKVTSKDSNPITKVVRETGVIQIEGEMRTDFIEPMTKERLLSKRINLYDFNIKKEYIYEFVPPNSGLIKVPTKEIVDTTDKALADAINEFYAKASEKICKYNSREEILSFQKQVKELKNIKRF